jgi:hypothetical protein
MKLTLKDVKTVLEGNIELLEMDFEHEKYGEIAKLLHKHYTSILNLLNAVDKK